MVPDTNAIISALNFPGNERLVLEPALRRRFELCLSQFILGEVAGVLVRKFGWGEERAARTLSILENATTVIEPPRLPQVIPGGRSDNRVLECAVAASTGHLVTGDRRHLLPTGERAEMRILNAPRFLSSLGER